MIIQVSSPNKLSSRWRNLIQTQHDAAFGFPHNNMDAHWWFVDIEQGVIRGFAGAKPENKTTMFLGPCVVFKPFRGKGLQRKFIDRREKLAKSKKFTRTVSCTHHQNYSSANNFVRCGYLVCPPWDDALNDTGVFIYWQKWH